MSAVSKQLPVFQGEALEASTICLCSREDVTSLEQLQRSAHVQIQQPQCHRTLPKFQKRSYGCGVNNISAKHMMSHA